MQASLRQALAKRRATPAIYPEGRFEGRGIVTCAGGLRYFTCAWVLVWVLRRVHRVSLPIQVWHLGRREMSDEMRLLLEQEGIEVVDAETVTARHPARIAGGWPLKPYAIAQSRFREVLFLDADTVPLVDPQQVFEWDAYRRSGILMWRDVVELPRENTIWAKLGLDPRDSTSIDSAVLAVDKRRAWDMLDLAVLMNEHVEEVYEVLHGDKDTFLMASLLLDRDFGMAPYPPFVFDGDLVHRDAAGDPFLLHRTATKWNLRGRNRPSALEALMPPCEDALAELRGRWSGDIFHPPERAQRARAEEARLISSRYHYYETSSTGGRRIELLPGGRVGTGQAAFEQHWAVIERDGILVLQLFSDASLTVEMTMTEDGSWRGGCVVPAGFSVRLVTEEARLTWPHAGRERIARSAGELVSALIDPALLAAGFDAERAGELRAALSLVNDRFDDVPEQIDQRLAAPWVSERWRSELTGWSSQLALRRDGRIQRTQPVAYPQVPDPAQYTRVP